MKYSAPRHGLALSALTASFALALTVLAGVASLPGAPAPIYRGPTAPDWPKFRGPHRDNHSPDEGLLTTWPEGGPRLVWKGVGVGVGYSSVTMTGDKVFTMGDKGDSASVFALDRATGRVLWSTRVSKAGGGGYVGPHCTPAVDGKLLYAISRFGDLVCLDIDKGEERWRKHFRKDYAGRSGGWNYCESPLIDGDRLVCTPGGAKATLVALNKRTGEEIWRSAAGMTAGYSSIVISHAAGVKQYVQVTNGGTVGVAAKDGKLLWTHTRLANNTANATSPVVLGDHVFTTSGYGKGGALLHLANVGGAVEAKELYYETKLKNRYGGVVAVGDYVYGDTDASGRLYCAEWKSGAIRWQAPPNRSKGRGSVAVTYADGHLYLLYANGYVVLAPADPKGYTESGSFKLPGTTNQSWALPVVIGRRLYLRDKDAVWCYDVAAK